MNLHLTGAGAGWYGGSTNKHKLRSRKASLFFLLLLLLLLL